MVYDLVCVFRFYLRDCDVGFKYGDWYGDTVSIYQDTYFIEQRADLILKTINIS